jgi:hypothetical protein
MRQTLEEIFPHLGDFRVFGVFRGKFFPTIGNATRASRLHCLFAFSAAFLTAIARRATAGLRLINLAGRLISGATALPALKPNREHIDPSGKQLPEQSNFVAVWRMGVYFGRIWILFNGNLVLNLLYFRNQLDPALIQFYQCRS